MQRDTLSVLMDKKPLRVLQVLDVLGEGSGVSSVVLNYYFHIDREQIQFDFMVNRPVKQKLKEKLEALGANIFEMPALKMRNYRNYQKALDFFFEQHREFLIIHGHLPNAAAFYLKKAKKYNVPVRIIHSHNSHGAEHLDKRIRNRILAQAGKKNATQYFACGKKAADYLYGKHPKREIFLLHNAIEIERFYYKENTRKEVRKKMGWESAFLIGHIGRFCHQKNQNFLLQIFEYLIGRDEQVRLLYIGDGTERRKIEQKVQSRGLTDKVYFLGVVENVEDYLQAMDVFVLPSRFEGLPVACIEAQTAGLPCIVSDAVTDEIKTDYTKFLPLGKNYIEEWGNQILAWKSTGRVIQDREDYDINREARRLKQIYLDFLLKIEKA